MKQFFKFVFASMLGFVLTFFVIALIIGGIIGVAFSKLSAEKEEKAVKDQTILLLSFKNGVVDRAPDNPFENFDLNTMESRNPAGLLVILDNLEKAAKDDKIKGILLDVEDLGADLATLDEVREGILKFKESGKFVLAYAETMGQGGYYLATAADKVFLYPEGDLLFKGLMTEIAFLKEMFEKLEIDMQVIRGKNNRFKSAVEPFLADRMSDANREQISRYLNSIWGTWVEEIAARRGISVQRLNLIADSLLAWSPEKALNLGLVDGLLYKDQLRDTLRQRLGLEADEDIEFADLKAYDRSPSPIEEGKPKKWEIKEKIAVVYGAGEIRSGGGGNEVIGAKSLSKALRESAKDSTIKAIVLRINSPGGSALASDVIWREVAKAREKKPVIVSMGALAASGGYYIACNADRIFAGQNTITGSIGVFGVLPNAEKLFNNKLGIRFDGVNTNQNSNIGMPTRALSPFQYEVIQNSVEDVYATFLSHVAEGREMSVAAVDSVGQGRVWTGKDALSLGLVDTLGGLKAAIHFAADKVGLKHYRLVSYPEKKSPLEALKENFGGSARASLATWVLGEKAAYFFRLERLRNLESIQARLPFEAMVY
jgi:protease-4